jgi:signal transduction histidine kinase
MTKAYEFSAKALTSRDSMMNMELQKQIAEMQVRYETEKKERLLKEQELQLAQSQLDVQRRNILIGTITALALLLGLLAFLAYRRYQWKQEARLQAAVLAQQESATKAVLEAEETERQRIAKDLHDGVGQLMSVAKMNLSAFEARYPFSTQEDRLKFDKIIQLVDESCSEVRTVSHNMMPNALLKKSLGGAVREFISKLDSKQLAAHLYTEGLDEGLDPAVETVLYRVIQECVNNVIKHAQATSLDISIARETNQVTITIEDNGKGFDPGKMAGSEGLGLKNIRTRIAYLKGNVDFDSAPGRGTLVAIYVPV